MKRVTLAALSWYRAYRGLRTPACRYVPTCTSYAHQAVQRHGVLRGAWLALRRVSRCHPLGGHGFDPVPTFDKTGQRHA